MMYQNNYMTCDKGSFNWSVFSGIKRKRVRVYGINGSRYHGVIQMQKYETYQILMCVPYVVCMEMTFVLDLLI